MTIMVQDTYLGLNQREPSSASKKSKMKRQPERSLYHQLSVVTVQELSVNPSLATKGTSRYRRNSSPIKKN